MRKELLIFVAAIVLAWAFPLWCWQKIETSSRNSLSRPRFVSTSKGRSAMPLSSRLNL